MNILRRLIRIIKCLYCDLEYDKENIFSLLFEKDLLCPKCRKELTINKKIIRIDDIKIISFYKYDSIFKSMLLQYKECYDEALKDIFLYKIKCYIKMRYFNYAIAYVPSSNIKQKDRGFNHLELIFEALQLKKVEGLRQKEDLSQLHKKLAERKKMLNNYIYEGIYYPKILLVDDVITTGASIVGCYKALKPYTNKLECLILSYV